MKVSTIIASSIVAMAPTAFAWTCNSGQPCVANNNWYNIRGITVHESCTRMNDGGTIYRSGESCAFFTDGAGTIFHGHCHLSGNTVACT